MKYYSRRPPKFKNRNYIEMREVFVGPAIINVEHNFEDLLQHKNDDTLTNVSLTDCRVPTNFGVLETYKKSLATFLLNLSRHKDYPVVLVSKKLENRSGQALSCKNRVEEALALTEPNLVTLKCLNDELNDLYRFYTEQSS